MEVDSASVNLKRVLEAKAAKDAKYGSGKKTKNNIDAAKKTNVPDRGNNMETEGNGEHSCKLRHTQDTEANKRERSWKEDAGGIAEQCASGARSNDQYQ